jgi:YD repeat-containing protein
MGAGCINTEGELTNEVIDSSLSGQSQGEAWTYDTAGNRLTQTLMNSSGTDTRDYSYNARSALTLESDSVSGNTTFGYDANGSQTSSTNGGNVTTYTYDVRNRLAGVTQGDMTTSYVYDDAGDRVKETTGNVTTFYLTDTQNPTGYSKPVEQWTSTTGNITGATLSTTYILGNSVVGQADSSGIISYLLFDGQANTRLLTDATGNVTATLNYDAFGSAVGSWSFASAPTAILFQQTMFDAPSCMNVFGDGVREARPGEDSFDESDPEGYGSTASPITLNSYLLENGNAINGSDPSGHDDVAELAIVAGISAALSTLGAYNIFSNASHSTQAYVNGQYVNGTLYLEKEIEGLLSFGFEGPSGGLQPALQTVESTIQVAEVGISAGISLAEQYLAQFSASIASYGGQSYVRRPGAQERDVTNSSGQTVRIVGQSRSSSETPGHDTAIDNIANEQAQQPGALMVFLPRSPRTATGRAVNSTSVGKA